MPVDVQKMREARAEKQKGADLWTPSVGDTIIYVCPPCREEDPLPFVEVKVHYGINPKGKSMSICLDVSTNTVLANSNLKAALVTKGKEKAIAGGCPVCEDLDKGVIKDDKRAKEMRAQSRYLWNLIAMRFRSSGSVPYQPLPEVDKIVPLMCGYRVWDKIIEQFESMGDLTDFEKAYCLKLNRKGTGMTTEWDVQPDIDSVREPLKLGKSTRAAIRTALAEGGPGDLYTIIAGMIRDRAGVIKIMSDAAMIEEEAAPDAVVDETAGAKSEMPQHADYKKACYGTDCAPADLECQKCEAKVDCAPLCGVEVPPDVAKPKPAGAKPGPKPKPSPTVVAKANGSGKKTESAPEPEAEEAATMATIEAGKCKLGDSYVLEDGTIAEYKGSAKGSHFFQDSEGKRTKLAATAAVGVIEGDDSEAEADEEPEAPAAKSKGLDDLEKALSAAKAKRVPAK